MKRARLPILLSLFVCAIQAGPAQAKCASSLSASNITAAWNQNFTIQTATFSVTKQSGSACSFAVGFTKGGSSTYDRRMTAGPETLRYQLHKDSASGSALKDAMDATSSAELITGDFPGGPEQTLTFTYYVRIPAPSDHANYGKAGIYTDTFSLRLYTLKSSSQPGSAELDDSVSVTIAASVPKLLEISIVPAGAGFDANRTSQILNFGDLSAATSKSLDLRVRSNAGFALSFSSRNNGGMRHSDGAITTTIPYVIQVDGITRDLAGSGSTPVVIATGGGSTSPAGVARSLVITPGSAANSMAGQYSDDITVTATTTE